MKRKIANAIRKTTSTRTDERAYKRKLREMPHRKRGREHAKLLRVAG